MFDPSLLSLSSSSSSSSGSEELFRYQIKMMHKYSKVMIEMGETEEKEQEATSSRRRGGSKMGKIDKRKGCDHKLGEFSLNRDYFGTNPVYAGIPFHRRFRMSEDCFMFGYSCDSGRILGFFSSRSNDFHLHSNELTHLLFVLCFVSCIADYEFGILALVLSELGIIIRLLFYLGLDGATESLFFFVVKIVCHALSVVVKHGDHDIGKGKAFATNHMRRIASEIRSLVCSYWRIESGFEN
ncbi:hypothetical protein GIB67_013182 [Kingdonia uniflora]|uniref:Uncharacterized protein n=1 Tax=Kingdonia uniflora TaxID=39325 RepID=A0A7J7LCR5_9MAGN|nr:hypothetical protein GIB67_013182 [Kingdonia uniflora]